MLIYKKEFQHFCERTEGISGEVRDRWQSRDFWCYRNELPNMKKMSNGKYIQKWGVVNEILRSMTVWNIECFKKV